MISESTEPVYAGATAKTVPGREVQLAHFDERLALMVDLHEFIGRIRVDVAPRGVGKTSLLRQAQRRFEARKVATIWVTAGEEQALTDAIIAEIRTAASTWGPGAKRALIDSLDGVGVSLGVPGIAKVDATWSKGNAVHPGARAFEAVIRSAVDAAESKGHTGIAIFIDEIQSADPESLRTISYAWQHLQSEGRDVPAAIFCAGLPNSAEVIGSKVTFTERFEYRPLKRLDDDAVRLALVPPARQLGVDWETNALQQAVAHAEGYPHKVQLIGHAAWIASGLPIPGSLITRQHVAAAVIDADEQMDELFRGRWRNSTPVERAFMSAMAELGDGDVLRSGIASALGLSSNDLSPTRANLIEKGFIEAAGRGMLRFTVPGFGSYLRERVDE